MHASTASPASGTSVKIYLPRLLQATRTEAARNAASSAGAGGRARGETMLLVEDNEEVAPIGSAALQELGYQVLEAADGPRRSR